jgi:hypothetical protein
MTLTWVIGLYTPVKDLGKGLAALWSRGLRLRIDVIPLRREHIDHRHGQVQAGRETSDGEWLSSRTIRGGRLLRRAPVCSHPSHRFQPSGPITAKPGETPKRWEARVLNEHSRREANKGNAAATVRTYGPRALARRESRQLEERHPARTFLERLLRTLDGPESVRIRAVLQLVDYRDLVTRKVHVPPLPPLQERLGLPPSA